MREWELKKLILIFLLSIYVQNDVPSWRKMPLRELFLSQVILQITNIMKSHTLLNKRCQEEP